MLRAVIYARYSSELQRDASIEDQIRLCKRRIADESWSPGDIYRDHAISGSIRMRPAYQKLLEDARAGAFDVVVAEALDRLSRDQEDERQRPRRPCGIELGCEGVFVLELPEARRRRLFRVRRQYQDRRRVAALPAAIKDELPAFPQRLQHVSGKFRHGGCHPTNASSPQRTPFGKRLVVYR